MRYKTARLHVVSGTGNTFLLACALADRLRDDGAEVTMHRAVDGVPRDAFRTGADHLVAMMGPAHGFTAPLPLLRLVRRLPRGHGTAAAIFLSRGSFFIGRWAIPGFEGTGCWLLAILMWLKGYSVRVVRAIDMPVNWTALHPGLSRRSARKVIARALPKLDRSADVLLEGRRKYRGFIPLLFGLLVLPISVLYLLIGRFFLAKIFFSDHRCTSCGLCAKNCPHEAIEMFGPGRRRPYWTMRCESCMRCMSYCPESSVQAGHSWAVLLSWLTMLPVLWLAIGYFRPGLPEILKAEPVLNFLTSYLNILLVLVLAYFVFYWVTRSRLATRLFAWTTFTTLYRRYHAPGVTAEQLVELSPVSWDAVMGEDESDEEDVESGDDACQS